MDLKDIWTTAAVLLGFELTVFAWRLSREVEVAKENDITWMPPSSWLILAAIVLTSGTFLFQNLPNSWLRYLLKLGVLLLVGYPFAVSGHYELYNPRTRRSMEYFPFQEKIVIIFILAVAILVSWYHWSS